MATPEEVLYLRRFNRIRLLRYVMFWLNIALFAGLPLLVVGYMLSIALQLKLSLGLFMGGMSAIIVFVLGMWLRQVFPQFLHVRPWLKIPDKVEVFGFTDTLAIMQPHPSVIVDIYTFFRRRLYVEAPFHWMESLEKEEGGSEKERRFEVAHVPGATEAVYWQKTAGSNEAGLYRRVDAVITDIGSHILKMDNYSIAADMKAHLPVLRAHSRMLKLAIGGIFVMGIGLVLSGAYWFSNQDYLADLRRQIDETLPVQGEVPLAALKARGLTGLRPDPELGTRLIHGEKPLTVVRVSRHRDDRPVLLTGDEFRTLRETLGKGTSPRWDYYQTPRQRLGQLQAAADRIAAVSPQLAGRVRVLSAAEDDNRSKSKGYCGVIRSYLADHWPKVQLVRGNERWSTTVVLLNRECLPIDSRHDKAGSRETFDQPVFYMQGDKIRIGTAAQVAEYHEMRATLQTAEARIWPLVPIAACALGILLMLWVWWAHHLAKIRVRREAPYGGVHRSKTGSRNEKP